MMTTLAFTQEGKVFLYVNGDTSMTISSWENNRRQIKLYDLYGNLTFATEDIRLSYTVSNQFEFHKNGAVKQIIQRTNPGASRYSYKTTYKFGSTNIPITKTEEKIPAELEDLEKPNIWFWSRKQQKWLRQEIVTCNPQIKEKEAQSK